MSCVPLDFKSNGRPCHVMKRLLQYWYATINMQGGHWRTGTSMADSQFDSSGFDLAGARLAVQQLENRIYVSEEIESTLQDAPWFRTLIYASGEDFRTPASSDASIHALLTAMPTEGGQLSKVRRDMIFEYLFPELITCPFAELYSVLEHSLTVRMEGNTGKFRTNFLPWLASVSLPRELDVTKDITPYGLYVLVMGLNRSWLQALYRRFETDDVQMWDQWVYDIAQWMVENMLNEFVYQGTNTCYHRLMKLGLCTDAEKHLSNLLPGEHNANPDDLWHYQIGDPTATFIYSPDDDIVDFLVLCQVLGTNHNIHFSASVEKNDMTLWDQLHNKPRTLTYMLDLYDVYAEQKREAHPVSVCGFCHQLFDEIGRSREMKRSPLWWCNTSCILPNDRHYQNSLIIHKIFECGLLNQMPDGSEAAVHCIMQLLDIYAKVPESNLEVAIDAILKHVTAFDSCVTVPQSPRFHAVPLNQLAYIPHFVLTARERVGSSDSEHQATVTYHLPFDIACRIEDLKTQCEGANQARLCVTKGVLPYYWEGAFKLCCATFDIVMVNGDHNQEFKVELKYIDIAKEWMQIVVSTTEWIIASRSSTIVHPVANIQQDMKGLQWFCCKTPLSYSYTLVNPFQPMPVSFCHVLKDACNSATMRLYGEVQFLAEQVHPDFVIEDMVMIVDPDKQRVFQSEIHRLLLKKQALGDGLADKDWPRLVTGFYGPSDPAELLKTIKTGVPIPTYSSGPTKLGSSDLPHFGMGAILVHVIVESESQFKAMFKPEHHGWFTAGFNCSAAKAAKLRCHVLPTAFVDLSYRTGGPQAPHETDRYYELRLKHELGALCDADFLAPTANFDEDVHSCSDYYGSSILTMPKVAYGPWWIGRGTNPELLPPKLKMYATYGQRCMYLPPPLDEEEVSSDELPNPIFDWQPASYQSEGLTLADPVTCNKIISWQNALNNDIV